MINPTIGDAWYCTAWSNNKPRDFAQNHLDQYDSRFSIGKYHKEFSLDGKGVGTVYGNHARLFVSGPWLNTEMSAYFYIPTGASGVISFRSRSNHEVKCGFGSYFCRWDLADRNQVRVGKEAIHPIYLGYHQTKTSPLPKDQWVELRLVTRNIENNTKVRIDAYTDGVRVSGGIDANNWPKIPERGSELWKKAGDCEGKGDKILDSNNITKAFFGHGKHCWIRCDIGDNPIKISNFSVREI